MKNHIPIFFNILLLFNMSSYSQEIQDQQWNINFDNDLPLELLQFKPDTSVENSWKIIHPENELFGKAISTNGNSPYATNDTISFTILHPTGTGLNYGSTWVGFSGAYKVDCDSLKDFGLIEMSLDKGDSWVNMLSDPDLINVIEIVYPITLTGKSDWTDFMFGLTKLPTEFNIPDTIYFKFSFISDSIQDNLTGLMYDEFVMDDRSVSINNYDTDNEHYSTVFPNPINDRYNIQIFCPTKGLYSIKIYDLVGVIRDSKTKIESKVASFDGRRLSSGIYFYCVIDEISGRKSIGSFVKY